MHDCKKDLKSKLEKSIDDFSTLKKKEYAWLKEREKSKKEISKLSQEVKELQEKLKEIKSTCKTCTRKMRSEQYRLYPK
jgi:predicted  nucleic acid-binding Zn-ribbon protein